MTHRRMGLAKRSTVSKDTLMRICEFNVSGEQRCSPRSDPRFGRPRGPENSLETGKHHRARHFRVGRNSGLQSGGPSLELPDAFGRANHPVLKSVGRFGRTKKRQAFFWIFELLVIGKTKPRLVEREQLPARKV